MDRDASYLKACLKSPSNRHPRMLLGGGQGVCKNLDSRQKLAGMTIRGRCGNDEKGPIFGFLDTLL
jgi:hypothetical protein